MFKHFKSRRELVADGVKLAAGAHIGLSLIDRLAGAFSSSLTLGTAFDALRRGDTSGMAYALSETSQMALVHIVLIDKVQPSLFQVVPGKAPDGSDGKDGAAQKGSDFRGMGLNKLFGDSVSALPDSVSLVLNNAWESGSNGHTLVNSVLTPEAGGINNAFEKLSGGSGLLGAVGFGLRSSAQDSADAFTGAGGKRMQTFANATALSTTLKNSVGPLLAGPDAKALLKEFDGLVTKDTAFRDALSDLAGRIQGALPLLDKAQAEKDGVMQQVKAIAALYSSGACRNFMLCVPWQDTNTDNRLSTPGGALALSPFDGTPLIGQALVALHAAIPNLVCVSTSDGGRDLRNSDLSNGFSFMTGPAAVVKNGIVGPKYTDSAQLGNAFGDVAHSDGVSKVSKPPQWYATALKAMGLDPGVEYVPAALQAG